MLDEARCKLALWRYDDNNVRPHLSRETRHPLKRGERLSNLSAPRTMRLRKTKPKNMKPKPANSRYECGGDNGADPDRNATDLDWRCIRPPPNGACGFKL